jgi:hypothetical protein
VSNDQPGEPARPGHNDSIGDRTQRAAFSVLRRARTADDTLPDSIALVIAPRLDPDLAWCMYSGAEGRAYIVPRPGSICFIASSEAVGTIRGEVPTALAADIGQGFVHSNKDGPVTFVGVLPVGGYGAHVVDQSGRSIKALQNADDGYWLEVTDPVAFIKTRPDGTTHQIPCSNATGDDTSHD